MQKRGISPLIATVLILGFTVALAAVIMTWGTAFTKKLQTQTEETSNIQLICATDVVFDIENACEIGTAGSYKLTIANNGEKKIDKFQVRFYESSSSVKSLSNVTFDSPDGVEGIGAFAIESYDVASGFSVAGTVKQIEAIPVITVGTKQLTCAQTIKTFGDVNNPSPIDNC